MAVVLGNAERAAAARGGRLTQPDDEPAARTIIWSDRSRRDLRGVHDHIHKFAPLAASDFTGRLVATVETLATYPQRGRFVAGTARELVVVKPYLVRYRVSREVVEIIRIRHGAQRPERP